jgi:hypothetical protein
VLNEVVHAGFLEQLVAVMFDMQRATADEVRIPSPCCDLGTEHGSWKPRLFVHAALLMRRFAAKRSDVCI